MGRAIFGAVFLVCVLGFVFAILDGSERAMAAWTFGAWFAGGWFIAMSVSAAAKNGDEGFGRDEGDE